jgi:hypothetical protein
MIAITEVVGETELSIPVGVELAGACLELKEGELEKIKEMFNIPRMELFAGSNFQLTFVK